MGEVLPQGNPPKSLRGQPRTPVRLRAHEKAQRWNSENDADDANDADIDITQLSGWDISKIASQASLASSAKPWRGKYGA